MTGDYTWEMPDIFSSGSSSWDTSNYSLTDDSTSGSWGGESASLGDDMFDFSDGDWYVDTTGGQASETSWLGDAASGIWDWLKSPQGTSVASGAIKGLMSVWGQDLAERMKGNTEPDHYEADLKDARIKTHNASINKPMDMGLIHLKRQ